MRMKAHPRYASTATIIAMVVVLAAVAVACGSTSPTTTAGVSTTGGVSTTAGQSEAQVTIKGFAFDPATVTIKVGESMVWTNEDSANHTVVGDRGEFQSGDLAKGDTFAFAFATAGTYSYHCGVHPGMKGTVIVQ
jgi:plastocyanin